MDHWSTQTKGGDCGQNAQSGVGGRCSGTAGTEGEVSCGKPEALCLPVVKEDFDKRFCCKINRNKYLYFK